MVHPGSSHLYGFSPVWFRMWMLRVVFAATAYPQMSHLYGFSTVWVLACCIRESLLANVRLQRLQTNELGVECNFSWILKPVADFRCKWQTSHSKNFPLLWVYMWDLRQSGVLEHLSQISHLWGLSSLWVFKWVRRLDICVNVFSHTSHL